MSVTHSGSRCYVCPFPNENVERATKTRPNPDLDWTCPTCETAWHWNGRWWTPAVDTEKDG